ncbi:condensation domain-containing protein, partial [Collimonas pratensis]|uniref:condensation domain-containing protein n=1 Tax=Collimonas pratensis TaxID=279113 RepID=UPI0030B80EF1
MIPKEITAGLRELSQQTQATLFMTLTAAFAVLLSRYSGQSDICIGTPIANRNRTETEDLIGFFVNTLALRTKVDGGTTFMDLIRQTRTTALNAYAHQDVPFEHLVEVLKPERHTSHHPVFQVMFTMQNMPTGVLELPELLLKIMDTEVVTAKFDLNLTMTEADEVLLASFEFNTDLFEQRTIENMIGHFSRLLEAVVAHPTKQIVDLSMLSQAERRQLLVEWNNTATGYSIDKTIHQLFEERAAQMPQAIALIFEDQQITYGQLNARANQLAHYLRAKGVGPEILVGICAERS